MDSVQSDIDDYVANHFFIHDALFNMVPEPLRSKVRVIPILSSDKLFDDIQVGPLKTLAKRSIVDTKLDIDFDKVVEDLGIHEFTFETLRQYAMNPEMVKGKYQDLRKIAQYLRKRPGGDSIVTRGSGQVIAKSIYEAYVGHLIE
jgi:predicted Abi (CAAX) family protease